MKSYDISFSDGRRGPAVATLSTKLPVLMIAGETSRCRLQPKEAAQLLADPEFDGPHAVRTPAAATKATGGTIGKKTPRGKKPKEDI